MTHATLHTTNHQRRAHPAVIRAALRSRLRFTKQPQSIDPAGNTTDYSYDGLLRLKELDIKDPGQSQVLNTQYGYDLTGNIVSKAISATGATATTNYNYDTLDHLTGATYSNSSQTNESYSYDPLANRITGSNANAQGSNHSYNANNQLTQAGSVSYSYDANGNTTSQTDSSDPTNTRSYVYDTDNRLIEVHDASNAIIATYRYDPFGRRLSKTLNTTTGQGSSTYYFYSAEGLIAEADANGQITQSYGYAPGSTFSTNPLWTKLSTAGTATYYTYQNDHLGTPQKLLNQSGLTVWSATYDAFGRATVDPASTITNNLRFPGQYYDAETTLHYNWFRYYDPTTGRYISADPIGLESSINMYAYLDGNPVNSFDPFGLFDITDPADWPTVPQGVVDFSAGFGDTLSFGLTDLIRDQMGTNGAVDKCSGAFTGGQAAGFVNMAVIGWAAGLNGGARSVFWSGGNKDRAMLLGKSLESTFIGSRLNKFGEKVPYVIWKLASATYAGNARGTAIKVGIQEGNIWRTIEKPILSWRNIPARNVP